MPSTPVISVSCNHCGAPLEVAEETRFVTCAHCGSRLEVHRSESTIYTQVLAGIEANTQRMADDLETIRLQNELERIDREWMIERQSYLSHDKDGDVQEPSRIGSIVMSIFAIAAGVGWMIVIFSTPVPKPMALFGVAFILIGIFAGIGGVSQADRYARAVQRHQTRRQRILQTMQRKPRS